MASFGTRSPCAVRIEQQGKCGSYLVCGWRYADLPIWHVNVSRPIEAVPEQMYVVAAGEFYPELLNSDAKDAVLRLIVTWEESGVSEIPR